jgi:hypothetical protein
MTIIPEPSKWRNWVPTTPIIEECANITPTKPSKPGSDGFVGSTSEETAVIKAQPQVDSVAAETAISVSWAEWKAASLNRLFRDQGLTGRAGKLTAATMRHGESSSPKVDCEPKSKRPMSPGGRTA